MKVYTVRTISNWRGDTECVQKVFLNEEKAKQFFKRLVDEDAEQGYDEDMEVDLDEKNYSVIQLDSPYFTWIALVDQEIDE